MQHVSGWLVAAITAFAVIMSLTPSTVLAQGKEKGEPPQSRPQETPREYTLEFVPEGIRQDGPRAWRVRQGERFSGRCVFTRTATGAELSDAERRAAFPDITLWRLETVRGRTNGWGGGSLGPYSMFFRSSGLVVLQCQPVNKPIPATLDVKTTVFAVEDRPITDKLVSAYIAREGDRDPVQRVSIDEPLTLHIRQFSDENRTGLVDPNLHEINWLQGSNACDTSPRLMPLDQMERGQQDALDDGTLIVPFTIRQAAKYTACVRFADGNGGFIDEEVSVTAHEDGTPPRMEDISITQAQFGVMDTTPLSDRADPMTSYEARIVLFDQDPSSVTVFFNSASGRAQARLVNNVQGRGVFAATLPLAPGLQIVEAVAVDGGGNQARRMTSFVAGEDMLSSFPNRSIANEKGGVHLYVPDALLDNSGTDLPSSIEQALANMSIDDWRALIGSFPIKEELNVGDLIGVNPGGYVNYLLDIDGALVIDSIDIDITTGDPHTIDLDFDLTAKVEARCFRRVYGNSRIDVNCGPLAPNGFVTVDATASVSIPAKISVVSRNTGKLLLAFSFDDDAVRSSFSVENDAVFLARGTINDEIRAEVQPMLTGEGLRELVFECNIDATPETCSPDAPLVADYQYGEWWFGVELVETEPLSVPLDLPMLFDDEPVPGQFVSSHNSLYLGTPWLGASLVGGFRRDDNQIVGEQEYLRYASPLEGPGRPPLDAALRMSGAQDNQPPIVLLAHVDTLNAWLASLGSSGLLHADMTPPAFLDLIAPTEEQKKASPFAALAHFPEGRVTITPRHAPRIVPRADGDGSLYVELDEVTLEIDLRDPDAYDWHAQNRSVLKADIALIARLDLSLERGRLSLNLDRRVRCPANATLSNCPLWMRIDFETLEGFMADEVLPTLDDPDFQAELTQQWDKLVAPLGVLMNVADHRGPAGSFPISPEQLLQVALEPALRQALPFEQDVPTIPLTNIVPLPIKPQDRMVIDNLKMVEGWPMDTGWIAFTAQPVTEEVSLYLREGWTLMRRREEELGR